jgi:hypothetical protein
VGSALLVLRLTVVAAGDSSVMRWWCRQCVRPLSCADGWDAPVQGKARYPHRACPLPPRKVGERREEKEGKDGGIRQGRGGCEVLRLGRAGIWLLPDSQNWMTNPPVDAMVATEASKQARNRIWLVIGEW